MTEPPAYTPQHHLFHHEAMKTTFSLRICEKDEKAARGMAYECFDQIDMLEGKLSRFIEGSDVHRINSMDAGETLYLSEECYRCLLVAAEAHAETAGLFDVTLGAVIEHRKSDSAGPAPVIEGKLIIHPDAPAVTCEVPGRQIDFGGIGKGFALDELKKTLLDWGARGGLVASGASTMLAFGPDEWPIDLTGSSALKRIKLREVALSASGTGIQGNHIVHPGSEEEGCAHERIWVLSPTAAHADAWSTAVMLMEEDEIAGALAVVDTLQAAYVDRGETLEKVRSG